jgi:UDP-glucuronate 4-epimerase
LLKKSRTEVVRLIEQAPGKQAIRELAPMQPWDLPETRAEVADLAAAGFSPKTPIADGIGRFIAWYRDYADRRFT